MYLKKYISNEAYNPNDGLSWFDMILNLNEQIQADNCKVFIPDRWDSDTKALTVYVTFHKLTITQSGLSDTVVFSVSTPLQHEFNYALTEKIYIDSKPSNLYFKLEP